MSDLASQPVPAPTPVPGLPDAPATVPAMPTAAVAPVQASPAPAIFRVGQLVTHTYGSPTDDLGVVVRRGIVCEVVTVPAKDEDDNAVTLTRYVVGWFTDVSHPLPAEVLDLA